MTRREILQGIGLTLAYSGMPISASAAPPETVVLKDTHPLVWQGDLSEKMMDGAHRYVEQKIAESVHTRQKYWSRDFSSHAAYEKSIEPNRARFLKQIGVVDARPAPDLEFYGDDENPALIAEVDSYRVYQVRWPALAGVAAEGLLLRPKAAAAGHVVALPDADQTPEQITGLAEGVAAEHQFARRLAESGFEVLVPVMIDRSSRWSGHPEIRMTDQSHREWIYRQAFHMGRHIIGYEVQKVLAAIDWFQEKRKVDRKIGVAGYSEGGLIAFYASAADTRIHAALVSGYFDARQHVWSEPIYRNVWALLHEFGDAELASLIAPRTLVVEYASIPTILGPRGDLKPAKFDTVRAEFDRIASLVHPNFQSRYLVRGERDTPCGPGSEEALRHFVHALGGELKPAGSSHPTDHRRSFDPGARQKKQVQELETFTQALVRGSEHVRQQFYLYHVMPEFADETWTSEARRKTYDKSKFVAASKWYRQYFWEEVLGKFQEPLLPPNPRTRRIYDNPRWTGYEVTLDVWPEVFAWGILLLPKDLKPGERRPVVVCQHGRRGVPRDVIEGDNIAYHDFAAHLADQGFITFAPHNLYRGEDRYRWLCRKSNGVKASLFSFIIGQHDQILRWLKTLDMVDPNRIAFYGLSYGGETAVRVPPILEDYCLSICSGDFNSWTRKVAATDERFSFMYSIEWEMPYFNEGSTFDYAEMTYLMTPRPFMAERGHWDQVGRDQWVSYEYAKVAWLYAQFGLADNTEIEYFNGGHTIHGQGTFRFLHEHLKWPVQTGEKLTQTRGTADG